MDIVQFFVGYVLLFGLILTTVVAAQIFPSLAGLIDMTKEKTKKVIMAAVPGVISTAINKTIYSVFYTRNRLLQMVSLFLTLAGNTVFTIDVLPILYNFQPDQHHILLPFLLLVVNLVTFHLSCACDPGRIVSDREATALATVYKADGVMFTEGNRCRTCMFVKPARSKHCNLCGYCVHRFDHHCLWTNNCVGGGNLRYFLLYLAFLQLMVAHGAVKSIEAMTMVARHAGMIDISFGSFIRGRLSPAHMYILIENLFLQYPRCILLVTSLMLLFVLIGLLILYHVMLIVNNQTTNEHYKMAAMSQQHSVGFNGKHSQSPQENILEKINTPTHVHTRTRLSSSTTHPVHSSEQPHNGYEARPEMHLDNANNNNSTKSKVIQNVDNLDTFYSRGILLNLKEVMFPWSDWKTGKVKPTQSSLKDRS